MVKVKVYAVRYREDITPFVNSFHSDPTVSLEPGLQDEVYLYIINNHSPLPQRDGVSHIYNNELRPNFSTGHLARNWNQAIINGFVDLDNPDCDAVVACQIDTLLRDDWLSRVKKIIENNDIYYFACGRGDECQIFKPQIIKKVGLFDERNCSIFYQEADYFLRALLYARENSVVLDYIHKRVFNSILTEHETEAYMPIKELNATNSKRQDVSCIAYNDSLRTGESTYKYFVHKWPFLNGCSIHWNIENILKNVSENNIDYKHKEYMLYPYFEDYGKINRDIYVVR